VERAVAARLADAAAVEEPVEPVDAIGDEGLGATGIAPARP
jgi:hypothetical protein